MENIIITEMLEKRGWIKQEGDAALFYAYEKKIENINPINASEDTDISLIVHQNYNVPQFAVLLPDGGMLNFCFETIEQLELFEKMIAFYDAPF